MVCLFDELSGAVSQQICEMIISQWRESLIGNVLSLFRWIFIEGDCTLPTPSYMIHLRYLGMQCG
jgi:hypothetical protein